MARETFGLLKKHDAVVMASAIPRGVAKPTGYRFDSYLRKDLVFLLERFFYFLEGKQEHGVLVMDETDKTEDRRFVARMEEYFTKTFTGRQRTAWIVPTPFFVSSDMTSAGPGGGLVHYCINRGFRLPDRGMSPSFGPPRSPSCSGARDLLSDLQFRDQGNREGRVFDT